MNYRPTHGVWEITNACNMRCKHCGSSCGETYPDELTIEEALVLCEDLGKLGLQCITLSGGEPFLHPQWDIITQRLTSHGIAVNIISNGWLIDENIIDRARKAGLVNFGISIDGLEETHDFIRKKGSFGRVMNALELLKQKQMPVAVNTSINKRNLGELDDLARVLIKAGVAKWQFQIASPMGNLLDNPDLVIDPEQVDDIINFIYKTMEAGEIIPYMADDIGYYNRNAMVARATCYYGRKSYCEWEGCHAGKSNIGIRANGDISGCLSIRDNNYIEDNIRNTPLIELWSKPGAFGWNRDFTGDNLEGFCRTCQYGKKCLGGCTGLKLTFCQTLADNTYCSYRVLAQRELKKSVSIHGEKELLRYGKKFSDDKYYQIAEFYAAKAHVLYPGNPYTIDFLGFIYFSLGSYDISLEYTERALKINKKNPYAWKVRGLCYEKMGDPQKGIRFLKKAMKYSKDDCTDIYINLAVILDTMKKTRQALAILEKGRETSPTCKTQTDTLYKKIKAKLN